MSILEGLEIDQNILEQTNPVFNTAKMTLFQLAGTGNQDAAAIVEKLGLTMEETQNSKTATVIPEQMAAGAVSMEMRYRTMGVLAEKSGCDVCIDLPCGYTPRAIEFAGKGIPFIGMDLPAAIAEAEPAIMSLLNDEEKKLVKFCGVDATNYVSLQTALKNVEGSVCITTEGLLMYFTDAEAGALCQNIYRILTEHGGCWITADPETTFVYISALKMACGDRFMEVMMNARKITSEKSDVKIGGNSLMINPQSAADGMKKAMAYLAKYGLKVERMVIADYLPELASVNEEWKAAFREAMKQCAYWKITVSEAGAAMDTSEIGSKEFDAAAELQDGMMTLHLFGRLDTITAPNLLAFYEKNKKDIKGVFVDCSDLEYISSAGLRILLMMHKGSKNGVSLAGVNDVVREILEQTGFDQILNVE